MEEPKPEKIMKLYGKIVNTYGSVQVKEHEAHVGALQAIPISKLPYTKKEIKAAIKYWLLLLVLDGRWDDPFKEDLKIGYAHLAYFIDDDKAKVVRDFWKSLFESVKNKRLPLWDSYEKAKEIQGKCHEELLKLYAEMSAYSEALSALNEILEETPGEDIWEKFRSNERAIEYWTEIWNNIFWDKPLTRVKE